MPTNDKTIKYYAKKYKISVMDGKRYKSVNELSTAIYLYELENQVGDGMYPFLYITN